ncbi:MAG: hypothetical protein H0V41_19530 [Pseudonocardiales bacterium]|nr:hypothetical protein [Pseudonocardiales bacterium]
MGAGRGGSAYTVHRQAPLRLVCRVDPTVTVTAAAEHAVHPPPSATRSQPELRPWSRS